MDGMMIHFNVPPYIGTEFDFMRQAVENHKICGDGPFTKLCNKWIEDRFRAAKCLLTTSGTSALEMAAVLCDFKDGEEVILPSYTFSSTATAFVLAGAKLVFVDIEPKTMNIDIECIKKAITPKTKCICVVHYAGISPDMDAVMALAKEHNLLVVEDAAQGVMSSYKGRALGTIGDFGCYSFHETKNYSMGEGGAIVINNPKYSDRAEIIREKGTNRAQYFRGQVAKYNWVDFGSSWLPSDLNAAYLWGQLQCADKINENRLETWNAYYKAFKSLENRGLLELPTVPEYCEHNAHMFYLKLKTLDARQDFIRYMKENDILCVFHYVPLHSAPAGQKFGRFDGEDRYTTSESDRLVRLPLYYGITKDDLDKVIRCTLEYFSR